jgi:hypothetical protein
MLCFVSRDWRRTAKLDGTVGTEVLVAWDLRNVANALIKISLQAADKVEVRVRTSVVPGTHF